MVTQKECDRCGEELERFRDLKKVNGERICKVCYRKNRAKHRVESIELDGAKEELKILDNKIKREYRIKKVGIERKPGRPKGTTRDPPKIKGSTYKKARERPSSYLTLHEKQNLFRILVNRGCDGEEAKERIKNLIEQQKITREIMKQKNKSDEEIKTKQQELLEELWRT